MQTGPKMGLRVWNLLGDRYSHDQLGQNFLKVDLHDHSPGRGAPIGSAGIQDGAVTAAKLAPGANAIPDGAVTVDKLDEASVLDRLGLGSSRRGVSINPGEETRTDTSYGTLPTADQVTVDLPTDGLIMVVFRALVKNSVASAGRAALFLNLNQVKSPAGGGAPVVSEAGLSPGTDYDWIYTLPITNSWGGQFDAGNSTSVTTGMIAAAPLAIEAAAGTYVVSVQYRSTSGSVSAKERKLWAWTVGF